MSAVSLYRSYRPQTFAQVVGQEHVIAALQQSIRTKRIGHAYLFCGTRGTGKTTLAKIFARAINCQHPEDTEPCNKCPICQGSLDGSLLDIIEMDAASNNSVDTIRRITDEVVFTPTIARYRVYIIDEVHMLSTGAFNALLKTLEEPPAHAVFILATTDPQRIPATILSRCQRYDLHAMTREQIENHLRKVASENNILATDEALQTLAVLAKGAMRDALSLLDQCKVSFTSPFGRNEVLELLGQSDDTHMGDWVTALFKSDIARCLSILDELINRGLDVQRLTQGLLQYLRDILLCKLLSEPQRLLPYPDERIAQQKALSHLKSISALQEIIKTIAQLLPQYRQAEQPRLLLEIAFIQLVTLQQEATNVAEETADTAFIKESAQAPQSATNNTTPKAVVMQNDDRELIDSQVTPEIQASATATHPSPSAPVESNEAVQLINIDEENISPVQMIEKAKPSPLLPQSPSTNHEQNPLETSNKMLPDDLWPRAYQKLQSNGGIILFILLKSAQVENTGDMLIFHFAANQEPAYNEFCKDIHQRKLAETLAGENHGKHVKIKSSFAGKAGEQTVQSNTIEQLRAFANKHHVHFEMEEENNG